MNERIFELAKQADLIQWDSLPSGARTPDHESVVKAKKFAELLIRECVNKQLSLAANYEATAEGYEPAFPEFVEGTVNGLKEGAELIRQHFGVEE